MKTIKDWLAQNNYSDILKKIQSVEKGWKIKGTGTRRDWWDVLAGTESGNPKTIEGIKFPILQAARIRKGWAVTKNSMSRNSTEEIVPVVHQARWQRTKDIKQVIGKS